MRRPVLASSLLLGLTLTAAPSCKVQVGGSTDPATGADPTSKAPGSGQQDEGKAPSGKSPKRTSPEQAAADVSVWGHFVVANPERMLKRVGEQLAPPMMGAMVSPSQLKSMLAMQLESRGEAVKHIDLTKPFGCVLVNPKQHDEPLACAVGFEGGITQLVEDLGQEGYQSGGDGFAAYELNGNTVYFKGWGDHIGVAEDPSLLASVEPAMKAVIEPGKADRDIYVEAKPSVIMVDAREEIEEFYSEMESAMTNVPPGSPGSTYASASAKAAMDIYRSLGDLSSAEFIFRIGKQRTKLMYRGTATKGTPTAKQYKRDAKLAKVDVAMMSDLPDDAWMIGGLNFDWANITEDPWVGAYFRAMAGTEYGGTMKDMMTAMADVMAGPTTMGIFPVKGSVGAMGASYAIQPGKDSMAVMREFLPKFKVESLMPEAADYVKSTYKKGAFTAGGVKVDTYTVSPTKKALAELKKDSDYAEMKKVFGEVKFTVAYAQKGDRQYLVMTTANAKKALERMMKAAKGKGNIGKFGDARKRMKANADGTALLMLDVKGMLSWARSLDVDGDLDQIPKLGVGLDDVVWTSNVNKKGKKVYELAVSQGFIDQLRSL
jgi:hypothetical protein